MARGSAYHALMQGHYEAFRDADAAGLPRDLTLARKQGSRRLNEYIKGEGAKFFDAEMLEELRYMYSGYVDTYGVDSEFDKIMVIDEKRIVPLVLYKGVQVHLQCTADLVVRKVFPQGGARWLILDHKVKQGVDAQKEAFKQESQLDPQRALYTTSFRLQGERKSRLPIFGAYHNIIRPDKLKREMTMEERYARAPVFYGDIELEKVWEETQDMARRAVEIHLGVGLGIYSSPDPKECSWRCSFVAPHLTARSTGRNVVDVAVDYGARRDPDWVPLAER